MKAFIAFLSLVFMLTVYTHQPAWGDPGDIVITTEGPATDIGGGMGTTSDGTVAPIVRD